MTQEEKQLLLKDLCTRLPYNVIGEYSWKCGNPYKRELTGNLMTELINSFNSTEDSDFKPYLRPMSSMTEEEKVEWVGLKRDVNERLWIDRLIDFYLSHHLDYRGLILIGLALEAPEDMYKTE